jgi:hypothetical protein
VTCGLVCGRREDMAPQPQDMFRSCTRLKRPRNQGVCVCVCVCMCVWREWIPIQCVEWLRKIRLFEREMAVYRTFSLSDL